MWETGLQPSLPAYIPQSFDDIYTEKGTAQALHQVQQRQDSSINIKTLPGCRKDMNTRMNLNPTNTSKHCENNKAVWQSW